jgi:TPR repeat protein
MGAWSDFGHLDLKPDPNLAAAWFRKAAEQGMVMAQYNLAMLLHAHPEETYYWLGVAAPRLKGEALENGIRAREIAAAALTPEQRAKLDERIKQWLVAHPDKN